MNDKLLDKYLSKVATSSRNMSSLSSVNINESQFAQRRDETVTHPLPPTKTQQRAVNSTAFLKPKLNASVNKRGRPM